NDENTPGRRRGEKGRALPFVEVVAPAAERRHRDAAADTEERDAVHDRGGAVEDVATRPPAAGGGEFVGRLVVAGDEHRRLAGVQLVRPGVDADGGRPRPVGVNLLYGWVHDPDKPHAAPQVLANLRQQFVGLVVRANDFGCDLGYGFPGVLGPGLWSVRRPAR